MRTMMLLLCSWLLAGVPSGAVASDAGSAVVGVRDVNASELVRAVCETPTESLVRFVDLDFDDAEEAVVTVACGEPDLPITGIFAQAPEFPILVDTLRGFNVQVGDGTPATLTAVVPSLEGDRDSAVVESVYVLSDGRLRVLDQRTVPFSDYLGSLLKALEKSTPSFDALLNPHLEEGRLPSRFAYTQVPSGYDPASPAPLLISLHGIASSGTWHEMNYFRFSALADEMGWIYVQPNGSWNQDHYRFWSATDACCNFYGAPVDDVAYIEGLIDDLSASYSIDPERIYVVGHSNGGFMAHRLACDLSDRITAIVSIAGAQWFDSHKCNPTSRVAVLEVHGDQDENVNYNGGALPYDGKYFPQYPSAHQTIGHWANLNGCEGKLTKERRRLDLDADLPGRETRVERFKRCRRGSVELWTIEDGVHFSPGNLGLNWPRAIFEFLIGVQP